MKNTAPHIPSKRVDAKGAAAFISEKLGTTVSPRSLDRMPIPYKVILRRKIYDLAEVEAAVEKRYLEAPRRIGRPA